MSIRDLNLGTKKQREFTRRHIKRKHLRYLARWKEKLGLENRPFLLCARPVTKSVPLASICIVENNRGYIIVLTPKTLRTNDWRDSIVHELLHAVFWECGSNSESNKRKKKVISARTEERLVGVLSTALAR